MPLGRARRRHHPSGMTLPALLLLAASLPAAAQVAVDAEKLEGLGKATQKVQKRLEPARADQGEIDRLIKRLIEHGEGVETELGPAWKLEGRAPGDRVPLTVLLFGGMLPPNEVAPGITDLSLRWQYSNLQIAAEYEQRLPDGGLQLDHWNYLVSPSGRILSVTKVIVVVKPPKDGQIEVDEEKSRILKMDPRDESVLRRWRALEKKLLFLGPTLEA